MQKYKSIIGKIILPGTIAYIVPVIAVLVFGAVSCEKLTTKGQNSNIKVSVVDVQTKSPVITTNSIKASSGFTMQAYVGEYYDYRGDTPQGPFNPWNSSNKYYFEDQVQFVNGEWQFGTHNWVANIPTSFWCYAPIAGERKGTLTLQDPASVNEKSRSFNYAMQHGTQSAGKDTDADNSDDLIFAFHEQTFNGSNEYVNLTFHHAMSQIAFCVSTDDGKFDNNLKIETIALERIPTTATCTINGEPANPDKPEDYFAWSGHGNKSAVTQTYDVTFKSDPEGWEKGTYTSGLNTYTLYSSLNNFFVIPHAMDGAGSSGTQLTVKFNDNGEIITRSKPINDEIKPGYYYKYKIDATVIGRTISLGVSLVDWQEYDDKIFIEET